MFGVADEVEKSPWYRLFWPLDADYSLRSNTYTANPAMNFDVSRGGGFPSIHNDYKDHENF